MRINLDKLYQRNISHDGMVLLGYFVFSVENEGYAVKPDDDTWNPVLEELVRMGVVKIHGRNIRIDPKLIVEDE